MRPDDDAARYALAHVLTLMGHLNEAEAVYQEILVKRPNELPAILAVAKLLTWQKKAGAANGYYKRALAVDPNNLEAKRGLADILYWTGEYEQALTYYEPVYAATHDPDVGQRIKEIRGERLYTPRAPVGRVQPVPTLPFRDYAKIGYGYYDYTKDIKPERDALLEAGKSWGDKTLVGRLEILNRFGFEDVPFGGDIYAPLWEKAWGRFTGMFAASPNFVANIDVGGEVVQGLGVLHQALAPVEAAFGYRHLTYAYLGHSGRPPIARPPATLVPSQDVDIFTPNLTVYLPHDLWLTEKVFYALQTGAITLSSRLTWRATDRVEVFASGAFGTSGERIVAVQDLYRAKTESYQAGLIFPFSKTFSGEVTGLYEDRGVLYTRKGASFNLLWHF